MPVLSFNSSTQSHRLAGCVRVPMMGAMICSLSYVAQYWLRRMYTVFIVERTWHPHPQAWTATHRAQFKPRLQSPRLKIPLRVRWKLTSRYDSCFGYSPSGRILTDLLRHGCYNCQQESLDRHPRILNPSDTMASNSAARKGTHKRNVRLTAPNTAAVPAGHLPTSSTSAAKASAPIKPLEFVGNILLRMHDEREELTNGETLSLVSIVWLALTDECVCAAPCVVRQ